MPLPDSEVTLRNVRSFRTIKHLRHFVCLATAISGPLVTVNLQGALSERSPFLPDNFDASGRIAPSRMPAQNANPLSQRIEFRGFYAINGEYRFLIKEKSKPAGRWVRLDDPNAEFLVRDFDPVAKTIRLQFEAQEELIELVQLESNATPMAISGQVAFSNEGTAAVGEQIAGTGGADRNGQNVRRRTPPPPPQWLQDRLAAQGVNTAAAMEAIAEGPPSFIPPPPPNYIPGRPPEGVPDPTELSEGGDTNNSGGSQNDNSGSQNNNSGGSQNDPDPGDSQNNNGSGRTPPPGLPGLPPSGPPTGVPGLPPSLRP